MALRSFLFLKSKGLPMMNDLYLKRNERKISVLYPTGGNKNVLRAVNGVKLRSGTGPSGKFITVQENNGQIRSLSVSKCVATL
tara:strand:- start:70 stop:318 length:249 start_codon:yes stop_codon:yes gene_type:complete